MHAKTATVMTAVAFLLAGCAGDDDNDAVPNEAFCEDQGLRLGQDNGTAACVPPLPPANLTLEGLADTTAFVPVEFAWVLETHKGSAHAMMTQVRVSTESLPADNTTAPEDYGTEVAKKEHQDFESGARYEGSFASKAEGTFHFRAYAYVDNEHLWSGEVVLEVAPVEPTGEVHDITFDAGALVSGATPTELQVGLGDAVRFTNEDVLARTVSFTGPSDMAAVDLEPMDSAQSGAFLVPGSYDWTSDDAGRPITGTITVTV